LIDPFIKYELSWVFVIEDTEGEERVGQLLRTGEVIIHSLPFHRDCIHMSWEFFREKTNATNPFMN